MNGIRITTICLIGLLYFLEVLSTSRSQQIKKGLEVQLKSRIRRGGSFVTIFRNVTIQEETLQAMNISKNELENGWLYVKSENENEQEIVLQDGRTIITSIDVKQEGLPRNTASEKYYLIYKDMEDLKHDGNLYPSQPKKLEWKMRRSVNISTVKLTSSVKKIEAWFDEKIPIFSFDIGPLTPENNGGFWSPDEGIVLTVFNLKTGKMTLQEIYSTNDFGVYRMVNWVLGRITPGSLILLVSLHAGSLNLGDSTRQKLSSHGSSWVKYYLYRDNWIFSYIQGGPVLADIFLPNLGTPHSLSSPVTAYFSLPQMSKISAFAGECESWSKSGTWEARRIFCAQQNGLRSLCDCDHPFSFPEENSTTSEFNPNTDIPITILTSGLRVLTLYRILEDLGKQDGLKKSIITIVMDDYDEIVHRLAFILGIQIKVHRPEGGGGTRISRVLRFALFQELRLFPKAKFFIVLEDDIVLSEDFYSYMVQASPIFEMDETVWCVTAFNLMAYPHTSRDPSLLYRGFPTPTLGWMMPRNVIEEILPKWPPAEMYHNWDFFLASKAINKGRICVIPDVLRSNHPHGGGAHFQPSKFFERHFSTRFLNMDKNAKLRPLNETVLSNYEAKMNLMIATATPVQVTNIRQLKLDSSENETYVIFLNRSDEGYVNSSRVLHHALGVWDSIQIGYRDVESFFYYNSTIIIASVPCNCSFRVPEEYEFFVAEKEDVDRLSEMESDAIDHIVVQTHQNGFQLPEFFLSESGEQL